MLFAIDDSEIEIDGRPHTILAAIGVHDAHVAEAGVAKLKEEFGLSPTDEIKWNGMTLTSQIKREALSQELLKILQDYVPLVVIHEGRKKQSAAKALAGQMVDYFAAHTSDRDEQAFDLVFDECIISDELEFVEFLRRLEPSPVALASVTSVRSHESAAIQLADVLAGFNRLATEIALGRTNKEILVWDDVIGGNVDIDLLNYICVVLRWTMWGEVTLPPDPENPIFNENWPFKHVGGFGLRIHSSISPETIKRIYTSRIVYMGCMH
jgi:Protein of unknown function (DUF3800)